jgi:hypothetical protein
LSPEPEPEPVKLTKPQEHEITPEELAVLLQEVPDPEPPVPEPEPEVVAEPPVPEPEPEPEVAAEPPVPPEPQPQYSRTSLGDYEEGIKRSVLDMLPEKRRATWEQILNAVSDITRSEIDAAALRDDFDECDKERYKFYVLNDERDSFWPVAYSDQIIDPMRCVMKFDEYEGSVEVFITYE